MEISQASSTLFVVCFLGGKKVKMLPEQLTSFERETARKYYNQKIGRKSAEQKQLLEKKKVALEKVTQLFEQFSAAKQEMYAIDDEIKQTNDSLVTFNRVLMALDKQDTIEEGLEFILDKVEEAQTDEEGETGEYKLDKLVAQTKEGDELPLI